MAAKNFSQVDTCRWSLSFPSYLRYDGNEVECKMSPRSQTGFQCRYPKNTCALKIFKYYIKQGIIIVLIALGSKSISNSVKRKRHLKFETLGSGNFARSKSLLPSLLVGSVLVPARI